MPPRARPEPFNPELRGARWLPHVPYGPRTVRFMRPKPKPAPSTAAVRGSIVDLAGGRGPVSARVFQPVGVAAPRPLFFWTHGGGLIIGSPQQDDRTNLALAAALGITVIATSYRLAPENPAPAAIDDVTAAFDDAMTRVEEFGVDPTRVAIGGASAGGGLTALLAQRLLDRGGVQPVQQVLIYPMLDDRTTRRQDVDARHMRGWTPRANQFAWTSYLGRPPGGADVDPRLVPARRSDLAGLPPAWIGVGTLDLFYAEDLDYAHRLTAANVSTDLVTVPGAFHGFDVAYAKTQLAQDFTSSWQRALAAAFAR